MKKLILAPVVAVLVVLNPAAVAGAEPGGGNSDGAHACQQGGYLAMVGAGGETFGTTGDCVSFAAHGGAFAQGLIVPAGAQARLSNVSFGGACDALTYGYQLNLGPLVVVDSKPLACPYSEPVTGATIGPFPTAVLLRVFLKDDSCGGGPNWTYFSDRNHALVTEIGPRTFQVGIMDSFFCHFSAADPRTPSGPGSGDLRLTVTIS